MDDQMQNSINSNSVNNNQSVRPSVKRKVQPAKSDKGCFWFFVIFSICMLLLFVVGIVFFVILAAAGVSDLPMKSGSMRFEEEIVQGSAFSSNKIAIIDVQGIILNGKSAFSQVADAESICEQLKHAQADAKVKAVIIRLNTPGGEVVASDVIHHEIMKLKASRDIPVVASMDSVAASGGYYIAVACDHIVANRLTMTGSIGVIMQSYEYFQMLQKIGVQAEVFKSGKMKDILNGARPTTPEEKAIVQDMVNETYNEFVKLVAAGRKGLTVQKIKTSIIGDGRILSGQQAKELGLVDQLGFIEDSIAYASQAAGLSAGKYKVVRYKKPFSLAQIFFGGGANSKSSIKVELPGANNYSMGIEQGKMYFLPVK